MSTTLVAGQNITLTGSPFGNAMRRAGDLLARAEATNAIGYTASATSTAKGARPFATSDADHIAIDSMIIAAGSVALAIHRRLTGPALTLTDGSTLHFAK